MYSVATIQVNNSEGKVKLEKGIEYMDLGKYSDRVSTISSNFLFSIKINLTDCAEVLYKDNLAFRIVTYVNSYDQYIEDGKSQVVLNIGKKEEKSEGYILVIDCMNVTKTNAIIIDRDPYAMIVALREGQYIEFSLGNKRKKIILRDGELFMSMNFE